MSSLFIPQLQQRRRFAKTLREVRFFILSSWAETGFGFEDWGNRLGKPDRVRIPDMPGDGMAAVLPKIGEDGGLDVVMLWMKLSWDV